MDKRLIVVTAAFLSLMIIALCLPLSSAAASLRVEVKNADTNAPIPGATVTLTDQANQTLKLTTGADGVVLFSNIPTGSYNVVASAPQYPTTAPHLVMVNGQTTTIVLFGFTKAIFTYTPQHPLVNQTLTFNATASTSSGKITDYSWDFGDGTTGTGITPTHTYTRTGRFTAVLMVTSTVGTATYTQNIPVSITTQDTVWFPWILLIIPLLLLIPLLLWRRRRYYVIIQARVPLQQAHPHCPGDGTRCEDCKVTPC